LFIVYAANSTIIEKADALRERFGDFGRVVFRNAAKYQGEIERCDAICVLGDFPNIVERYKEADIEVVHDTPVQQAKKAPRKSEKEEAVEVTDS
jgi:hypothetical protein